MENNGRHYLRIFNMSTPDECQADGFSQTACGFVVGFADTITTYRMNPWVVGNNVDGNGNIGGWEKSDMRAFLNGTKYLEGEAWEIDYTDGGIYNDLPSDLRDIIIDTTVVSGHGPNDSDNFVTTDKIYLLSTHEVWEDVDGNTNSGIDYYDTAYTNTRQMDYYTAVGVTASNNTNARKGNSSNIVVKWWLRSPHSGFASYFYIVNIYGANNNDSTAHNGGVSPAFRIG